MFLRGIRRPEIACKDRRKSGYFSIFWEAFIGDFTESL
ncbi:hypothetical protein EVA_13072 [gut metagenome]|uniref:Uncharacterized protein n=1 Tax=gut metagenome TaxID=749906 RepID=J9CFM3_9ZZZZ